jgi:hypothetical protein
MQVVHGQWLDVVLEGVDGGGEREAPSTNIQAPENNQIPTIKLQIESFDAKFFIQRCD